MYSDRSALQLYKKVTYATLAYREKKTCWTVIIYMIQLYYFFLFNFLFLIKRVMVYRYGYKHWIRHPSFLMEMGYPFFKCCNWWQLGGDGMDTWLPWCLWPLSMVVSFLVWPYMYCLSRITSIDISCFQSYFFYFWKNDEKRVVSGGQEGAGHVHQPITRDP